MKKIYNTPNLFIFNIQTSSIMVGSNEGGMSSNLDGSHGTNVGNVGYAGDEDGSAGAGGYRNSLWD